MSHALNSVRLTMCPVIRGVDAPLGTGGVVGLVADPVHDWVAQPHIFGLHIDAGAQAAGTVGEFPGTHPPQQVKGFFGRTVAIGTFNARLTVAAALLTDSFGGLVVNVGQSLTYEVFRPLVKLLEIVRRVDNVGRGVA